MNNRLDSETSYNEVYVYNPLVASRVKDEDGENDDNYSEGLELDDLDYKFCEDDDSFPADNGEHSVNGFGAVQTKYETSETTVSVGTVYPFFCDDCKQSFVSKSELQKHIESTKHKSQLSSRCFLCQQIVHDSLRFHLLEAHWKLSPFKCKLCSYIAIRPSQVS